VARPGGRVWFVAGALPGERVEAVVERERAGVVEARAAAILAPSERRERAPCTIAGRCGGCDLAHVRREATADVLREVVAGALRHARPELAQAVRGAAVAVSPMGWRLRARLHWDPRRAALGFLGARSHDVVAIDPCRVVSSTLLDALPLLESSLRRSGVGSGEVEWLETLDARSAVAGWRGGGSPPRCEAPALVGWQRLDRHGEQRSGGWGADGVVMALPTPLFVPAGAFFQGNRFLLPRLFERIAALAASSDCERVVDLFGGVGLLAAAASLEGGRRVTVVEAHRGACAAARRNLPGAAVVGSSAEEFLADPGAADGTLVLLDPPRSGLSEEARSRLGAWRPEEIVLLGCDAARFGRDVGTLLGEYHLESLELWDLFAGTHHAEILAVLRR
jgi:23S rRNA (uracil1939-C5)-methyltransferase